MQPLDVLVIGGGQAGLALGHYLTQTQLRFQIVERNPRVGDSWRHRYDSLVLFTPRAYSALPGLPLSGDPDAYPGKDEIADYLEAYARRFALPIALGIGVRRLERVADGFRATTDVGGTLDCRAVVLATGAFQEPAILALAGRLSQDVVQLTPATYKDSARVPPGRVLVVGDGATGRQIAAELAATHRVVLASSGRREPSAERILGKSIFWWMDRLGILLPRRDTRLGRYLMNADPFPGRHLRLSSLRKHGVAVVGRLTHADGRHVTFAGGERIEVDAAIWATGYRDRTDWVAIPAAKDAEGSFVHDRGVSPVPRLYFIGRNWQWTHGSSRLYGVGADAAYVVEHMLSQIFPLARATVESAGHPASTARELGR